MNDERTLGQLAFDAYSTARGWKDVRGGPIPTWDELDPAIRDAWELAAATVAQHVQETRITYIRPRDE